jgi:hypothetical protein
VKVRKFTCDCHQGPSLLSPGTTDHRSLLSFGTVWLDERVTQDSYSNDGIRLFRPDREVLEFLESSKGLHYYYDTPATLVTPTLLTTPSSRQ